MRKGGREVDDRCQLEMEVSEFFSTQPWEFWQKGNERLLERWGMNLDLDWEYIVD